MGVEYNSCQSCGESKYEEYVDSCCECGANLCTACLNDIDDNNSSYAHEYGYRFDSSKPELMEQYVKEGFELYNDEGKPYYEDDEIIDDSYIASKYCPYCNGDEIDNERLLAHIIEKYNINVDDEWSELKNKK